MWETISTDANNRTLNISPPFVAGKCSPRPFECTANREETLKKTVLLLILLALLMPSALGESQQRYIPSLEASFPFRGIRVVEPPDDVFLDALDPEAFGIPTGHEGCGAPYLLMADTPAQTMAYLVESGLPGPRVYLLAGTHGDERAGWYAALMLKDIALTKGSLVVLPQANKPGCEALSRYVRGSLDLNRSYPGRPSGDLAQQLAHAILKDIQSLEPTVVLDLHEAAVYAENRDFLGNTVIYTSLDGMGDLFFSLLVAFENAQLGARPYQFVSPGVADSLNSVAPAALDIPVLTVETFRGYPLSRRVQDQVDIVLHCLRFYGMVND